MSDLFDTELFEERAAVKEFDGLMSREQAEAEALIETERHRHACEVRSVIAMPSQEKRRAYLADVEKRRGKEATDRLKADIQREWSKRK